MIGARRRYFSVYAGPTEHGLATVESHIRAIGGELSRRGTCHVYGWIVARDAIDACIQLQDAAPDYGYRALDVVERGGN